MIQDAFTRPSEPFICGQELASSIRREFSDEKFPLLSTSRVRKQASRAPDLPEGPSAYDDVSIVALSLVRPDSSKRFSLQAPRSPLRSAPVGFRPFGDEYVGLQLHPTNPPAGLAVIRSIYEISSVETCLLFAYRSIQARSCSLSLPAAAGGHLKRVGANRRLRTSDL